TLDLAATFYDLANTEKPEEIQSESLLPLIANGGSRDMAYNEWNLASTRCGVPLELRTIRTKTHKCTFELISGAGELYDLANDPLEQDNLYEDSGAAKVRKELEDMMRARPGKVLNTFADPVGAA
ncbi:MAG: DUF4976 domain-containing protein, partial [Alphaproteobacteria bacterium]|nr:DUF4976 domain-containing protein [Alphaproteobacteria bacterium]